jgi:hypothetical protein
LRVSTPSRRDREGFSGFVSAPGAAAMKRL